MNHATRICSLLHVNAKLALYATLSMVLLPPAWGQTPETEVPVQSVQITGVRDPAIMPYQTAYEILNKVSSVSNGRVQLLIKVTSATTHAPIPDLDISLRGETTFEKLTISPSGFITVPLSQDIYNDRAEFLTNKKKGSLSVAFYLVPKLSGENLSYGEIVDGIQAARHALAQIIPWYLRLLSPSITGVGICYPDNHQTVLVSKSKEAVRPATTEETNIATNAKVFCANFSSTERSIARDSIISPASGWDPIFR
ncbi:hypothetical protein [Massilia sp. S19_KUP03_FR1]|uniref:hypothetical protein n=1 Tax=Massilia sp. S19_KUP03_FR1 TaxID=3025503 RepID=UPI002FCDDB0A